MRIIPFHGRQSGKTTELIAAARLSPDATIITINEMEAERIRCLTREDSRITVRSVSHRHDLRGRRTEFFLDNGELLIQALLRQYSPEDLLQLLFSFPIHTATFET